MKNTIKQKRMIGNEKGLALIWAYLVSVFLLTVLTGFYSFSTTDVKLLAIDAAKVQAFYLAEAGIDKKLAELRGNNFNAIAATSLGNIGTYEASYDTTANAITATGATGNVTTQIIASLDGNTGVGVPPGVSAALTVSEDLTIAGTAGLVIDGRDHDADGNLMSPGYSPGRAGIAYYSATTPIVTATTLVGGYEETPSYPASPSVIYNMDSNAYDLTPNSVLGLISSSTALNPYKVTSVPSQLNNEIKWFSPFVGTSFTVTMGTALDPWEGTFIVYKATGSPTVKLKGSMKGLIVCGGTCNLEDADILGAVVSLKTSPNTMTVTSAANSASSIKYSEPVLEALPEIDNGVFDQTNAKVQKFASSLSGSPTRVLKPAAATPTCTVNCQAS